MSTNKNSAPEVPAQEQPRITFDYGAIETSRFYITTDKNYYEKSLKNPKVIPMFTPELLADPITKEKNKHDLDFYIIRIPCEANSGEEALNKKIKK